jgi:ribonuclease HII
MKYIIGIDEVGRGPVAGPVVVCALALSCDTDVITLFPKGILRDSKKLSERQRKSIIEGLDVYKEDKRILFGIGKVSAERIDEIGINPSIQEAITQALSQLHAQGVSKESFIFLDGSLHVSNEYQQETIIKGDEKIIEISLASIIAKEYRDTLMKQVALEIPGYGFENHVGYGTAFHYEAIKKNGLTKYHRKTFLKSLYSDEAPQ